MFTPRSTSRLSWSLLAIVLTLSLGGPVNAQLIQIRGNDRVISNGDTTPSGGDHTNFGQVLAGSGPVDREFIIRNLSSAPLQIRFFQRTGQHPGNFTVIDPPDLTIPGNGDSSMTIRFLPSAAGGLRTATIRIVSTSFVDGDFRFDVAGELVLPSPNIVISGNGVEIPDGFFSPIVDNNTDFETLGLDDNPLTRTFTISNTGEQDLRISSVDVVGINSDQFSISRNPDTFIGPDSESTFDVTFDPTREGAHRVTVHINSNDPTPTERIYSFSLRGTGQSLSPRIVLSGNGIDITPGDETPGPEDHTRFPDTDLLSASTRTFTVRNSGNGPLLIDTVELLGPHAAGFTVAQTPATPLEPEGVSSLQVTFRPTVQGPWIATLRITSNDPAQPVYEVDLEGIGGRFKLLGIEQDDDDALISFSTNSSAGTYIYRIFHSTDMEEWESVGSILSNGRETLQFRHRNSTGSAKAFWYVEELRFE